MTLTELFPSGITTDSVAPAQVASTLRHLKRCARAGDRSANAVLGYWYQTGFGVEEDERLARHYYQCATDAGCGPAAYNLGIMYYSQRDFTAALSALLVAASNGVSQAHALIGSMYEFGRGVPGSTDKAIEHYRLGVAQDNHDAALHLASLIRRGIGALNDVNEGRTLLMSALSESNPNAWYELSLWIDAGLVDEDAPETASLQCCEKAALLGHEPALTVCGEVYAMGRGNSQDLEKGLQYIQEAIEKGSARAKYLMAVLLARGIGLSKDPDRAYSLCCEASELGIADAMYMRGLMLIRGDGVSRNSEEGQHWLEAAQSMKVSQDEHSNNGIEPDMRPLPQNLNSDHKE